MNGEQKKEICLKKTIRTRIQWMAGLLFAFSIIAVALISSFEIAMYSDFGVYEKEYKKYDVLSDLNMTMEDTMYVTREMMAYLRGDREELSVITTVEGKEQDFFNEQDRFHMEEVRGLFIGGLNIRTGACIVALLCVIILIASGADMTIILPRTYHVALIVIGTALIILGLACAADFNAVFVEFHHIFFDNDLWLFDPAEDYMIRMLPEGLFFDMVIRIGIVFAGMLTALLAVSFLPRVLIRKTYHKV